MALCLSLIPPAQNTAVAQEKTYSTVQETVSQKASPFQAEVELKEERTATSQVFQQADGALRLEISPEPIHVQNDKTDEWETIDNTLIEKESGRYHNALNEFDASFAADSQSSEPLVSLEQEGKTVEIEAIEHNGESAASAEALVEENKVTYEEIYPGTDLVYTVGNDKVKEDIILQEMPTGEEPLAYDFQFKVDGLVLEETEDGYLFLLDKATKERLFAIEKPFMMDSYTPEGFVTNMEGAMPEGALSDKVKMTASQQGDMLFLTLAPDMEWLTASERVYPVTIDPTIRIYQPKNDLNDTTIRSGLPDTTGGADTELGMGLHKNSTSTNIVRSLIQFDVGTLPKGAKVMSAQLNLHLSSVWNETPTSIQLFEAGNIWEENRATWNRRTLGALWSAKGGDYKQPSLASQTVGILDPTLPEPPLYKWTIAPEVAQKWIDQPSQNLGLLLKAQNETLATYKKFYSGDASGTTGALKYSPKLSIVYYPISRLGLESYWSYAEHGLSDGQGYVNLGTGNLVIEATDFSIVGRGNSGFSFSRTYNSKAVEDSPVGYGWSFIGSESVSEFPNRNVLYQDGDGTTHLFTYNAAAGTYTAPAGTYLTLTKANADAFVLADYNGNRIVFRDLVKVPESQTRIYRIDYEEDRNKNKVTYQRTADGRLVGISDATGRVLSFQYTNSRISSTTFEGVKKTAYTYYADGRLKSSTIFKDATTGSVTTYQYNSDGLLSTIIDANGEMTQYLYEQGFLKAVKQPMIADEDSNITYDYSNLDNFIVSEKDARGNKTIYQLNSNYTTASITDPIGFKRVFIYDSNYNLLSSKDPKGYITTNTYDLKGNVLSTTDSLGNKTVYTYNSFGQPLTMTDTNGTVTYVYNSYGDRIKEIDALEKVSTYVYHEPYGNLKSLILPSGATETYAYEESQNYLTKSTDSLNRTTSFVNDKFGNVIQLTDANGNLFKYEYDNQNRLVSVIDANNVSTTYTYDANGNLTNIKNGNNHVTGFEYNSQNQLVFLKEPLGQVTKFRYDTVGNIIEVLQPDGTTAIRTEYDTNNQPTGIKINNSLKWKFGYDPNGNRIFTENLETGTSSIFTYDELNRRKTESTANQLIEYAYSPTGSITTIKGNSGSATFTQTFQYDMQGQMKYVYRNGTVHAEMDYTDMELLSALRYVNGIQSHYNYDAAQQLTTLTISKGTTELSKEISNYDLNGNLISVTSTSSEKLFSYDKQNQLTKQVLPKSELTESYTYDNAGNRISKTTVKNNMSNITIYKYDANNRLVSAQGQAYTYDANGNRKKDEKYNYIYNKFDQLIEVQTLSGAIVASYTYDDQGRRISKMVGGEKTYYHYGQGIQVLYETDSSGNITAEFNYDSNGLPLMLVKNGQTYYYMYNSLGEIFAITDRFGSTVATYVYDAWGNILSESGPMASENPIRYKGYQYDEETNFYYLIARYYQPSEGLFLAKDPESGSQEQPRTQNGYNYVLNNPIMLVDYDGHAGKPHKVFDGGKAKGYGGSVNGKVGSASKSINIPSHKSIKVDMNHVKSRHTVGGVQTTGKKDLFPSTWSDKKIKDAIMTAYKNSKKIQTQGDSVKLQGYSGNMKIEMWVNVKTKTIKTAYPKTK